METKKERFTRLAENRTNKIINMIRLLGNCANKSNYEYNEQEVNIIFETLKKELNACKNQFDISNSNKTTKKFKLK